MSVDTGSINEERSARQTEATWPQKEGGYILVADDDPDARVIMCSLLKMLDWETIAVKNGAEALAMIETRRPSLITLDLMMPVMNGFEVLGHLKAGANTRDIPIIILSALGNDQRLARLGANSVIQKGSLTIDRLRQAIQSSLPLISSRGTAGDLALPASDGGSMT